MATHAAFLEAQDATWSDVLRELHRGRKTSHWIWWVFPQLEALGRSPRARHFGLADLDEARAYLGHPVLRANLEHASRLLLQHAGADPALILGDIDAAKVKSCLTLFEAVDNAPPVFSEVLDTMYGGARCARTRALIG